MRRLMRFPKVKRILFFQISLIVIITLILAVSIEGCGSSGQPAPPPPPVGKSSPTATPPSPPMTTPVRTNTPTPSPTRDGTSTPLPTPGKTPTPSPTPVLWELHWDGAQASAGGYTLGPFEVSTHFSAATMNSYLGGRVIKVKVYIWGGTKPTSLAVKIYKGGASAPITNVCTQAIDLNTISTYSWNEITLTTPVTITNEDLWVGFSLTSSMPSIGTDNGSPVYADGDWENCKDGSGWIHNSFKKNWSIHTIISVP